MDLQNLLPQQTHPIRRKTMGQLPVELAELSELNLSNLSSSSSVLSSAYNASSLICNICQCSYEGDEAE